MNQEIQSVIDGESEGCIICGDSLAIMADMPDGCVDSVITDPPYNIGYHYKEYCDSLTDDAYRELLRQTLSPPSVVIHYPEDMFEVSLAINELPEKCVAWVYNANTPRQWRMVSWFGIKPDFSRVKQPYKNLKDRRILDLIDKGSGGTNIYDWWQVEQVKNVSDEKTKHPCQIPLDVMKKIIGITPANIVLDPFAGSGTTCVAAKATGRKYVGIELDPEYCEIAKARIAGQERPLF